MSTATMAAALPKSAVFNDSWSDAQNRSILESVKINGLASPSALKEKGVSHLGSVDGQLRLSSVVCINAISYECLKNYDRMKMMNYLIRNPAAGISTIALERRTDETHPALTYVKSLEESVRMVTERIHQTALIVLNSDYIKEHEEGTEHRLCYKTTYNFMAECGLETVVPYHAFERVFVPSHLVSLFKSIFPEDLIYEVGSKESDIVQSIPQKSLETLKRSGHAPKPKFDSFLRERKFSGCSIPNYEEALATYMNELVASHQEKPLMLHLLRLKAPSDHQFLTQ